MYRWLRLNAGVGKSFCVRVIIQALGLYPEEVAYIAFTGRAAEVLRKNGNPNAITAHKLLYNYRKTKEGKYVKTPKPNLVEEGYKLIVVDEVSMLPKDMWALLLRHKIPVIALGDPEQLPPVSKDDDNQVLNKPHVFLDEIMRQAKESEIIRFSMWIREGNDLSLFPCEGKEVKVFSKRELTDGMLLWPDQIICATNRTRRGLNQKVRQLKGYSEEPVLGDRLVSLRNHWDDITRSGAALTNGTAGTLASAYVRRIWLPSWIKPEPIDIMYANLEVENGEYFEGIPIDYKMLFTGEPTLTAKQVYQIEKNKKIPIDPPYEFDYSFAASAHKTQGSQYSNVLVYEETFPYARDEHRRWLYTAATRPQNRLVVIKK